VRIRLYFDEDCARQSLARELRFRGMDVVVPRDVDMLERTDEEQLECAARNNRVVYSLNRKDFYKLHAMWVGTGRSHTGIILSRQNLQVGEQMRRLLRLASRLTAEEMINRVEFLTAWG